MTSSADRSSNHARHSTIRQRMIRRAFPFLILMSTALSWGQHSDDMVPSGHHPTTGAHLDALTNYNKLFMLDATRNITGNPVIVNAAPQLELRDSTGGAMDLILRVDGDMVYLQESGDANGDLISFQLGTAPRFGIGISPTRLLHVYRNSTAVDQQVRVDQAGTGDANIGFSVAAASWLLGLDNSDGDRLKFSQSATDVGANVRMTLETGGDMGIGITNPLVKVHAYDGASGQGLAPGFAQIIAESSGDAGIAIFSPNTNEGRIAFGDPEDSDAVLIRARHGAGSIWTITTEGVERYRTGAAGFTINETGIDVDTRIEGSGNVNLIRVDAGDDEVGIGINPTARFHVSGSSDTNLLWVDDVSDTVNVGGTLAANKFTVSENSGSLYIAQFFNDGDNADRKGIAVRGGADSGSGTTSYFAAFDGNGTLLGGLQNNSGTFQVFDISGRDAKKDIAPTQRNGTDIVMGVPVVEFRYNGHDALDPASLHTAAFIAEDFLTFYPDAVSYDSEAQDPSRAYTLARSQLIPILWKFGQEQYERAVALQEMVDELSAQVISMGEAVASLIGQTNFEERNAVNGWIEYQSLEHANMGD